jgi:hypothetical protein
LTCKETRSSRDKLADKRFGSIGSETEIIYIVENKNKDNCQKRRATFKQLE